MFYEMSVGHTDAFCHVSTLGTQIPPLSSGWFRVLIDHRFHRLFRVLFAQRFHC